MQTAPGTDKSADPVSTARLKLWPSIDTFASHHEASAYSLTFAAPLPGGSAYEIFVPGTVQGSLGPETCNSSPMTGSRGGWTGAADARV